VELSREEKTENPAEKVFIVKGTAEQIAQVKQMIYEKIANAPDVVPHTRYSPRYSSSPIVHPQTVLLNPANYGFNDSMIGFGGYAMQGEFHLGVGRS